MTERLGKMVIAAKSRDRGNDLFNRSLARSIHVAICLLLGRARLTGPELHYLVLMLVRSAVRQWPEGGTALADQLQAFVDGIRSGSVETLEVALTEVETGAAT